MGGYAWFRVVYGLQLVFTLLYGGRESCQASWPPRTSPCGCVRPRTGQQCQAPFSTVSLCLNCGPRRVVGSTPLPQTYRSVTLRPGSVPVRLRDAVRSVFPRVTGRRCIMSTRPLPPVEFRARLVSSITRRQGRQDTPRLSSRALTINRRTLSPARGPPIVGRHRV